MGGRLSVRSGAADADDEPLADILRGNYPLAHKIYQVLRQAQDGDICFSPALLQLPLGALQAGASGRACTELHALLHPGGEMSDHRRIARGHAALRDRIHGMKDVTIATALRIYTPDTMKLVREWFVSSTKNFSICIKPTNFIKSQEELLMTINSWVRSKTKNQIDELIPPETTYSIIQLLMVCAAYFQCDLEYPFHAENTTSDLFYVNSQDTRPIKLMHQVNIFRYAELDNLKCQVLEMPYKNPDLRFIVLLPFTADGLPALEQDFVHINFADLLENMIYTKVLVSIPSFRLQESYDFCDYLDEIGLPSLMRPSEQPFTKVSEEDTPASLTHFNHMMAFNFMEENKEQVPSRRKKLDIEPDTVVFRADHSFMFFVLDATLNMILIIGRINCLNRFTTPTFQRVAFNQLDKQCQHYLDDQIPQPLERETSVITETLEMLTEGSIETAQAAEEIVMPIDLGVELQENVSESHMPQVTLNDNFVISSY